MNNDLVKTVYTDDFQMDYVQFGNGSIPLVIIPGLSIKSVMKSANTLQAPYKIFTDKYTLYFFDRKKEISSNYSIEEMALDQVKVFKALGLKHIVLYGVSQGGMIAQHIAINNPDLVWKLVLGSTSSKAEPKQLEVIGNWTKFAQSHDKENLIESFIQDCFSESFKKRYLRALQNMYKNVSSDEMDRFSIFSQACDFVNTTDKLNQIKCPTLILSSSEDNVVTCEASYKIADKLKSANVPYELKVFEGYGHAAFDELKEYKEMIFQFLESN